jgi:hypothetical protein
MVEMYFETNFSSQYLLIRHDFPEPASPILMTCALNHHISLPLKSTQKRVGWDREVPSKLVTDAIQEELRMYNQTARASISFSTQSIFFRIIYAALCMQLFHIMLPRITEKGTEFPP